MDILDEASEIQWWPYSFDGTIVHHAGCPHNGTMEYKLSPGGRILDTRCSACHRTKEQQLNLFDWKGDE